MPFSFDTTHYVDIIVAMISSNTHVRGYQSKLADAAGCQSSYFSQVLRGKAHLTLDQASSLTDFWEFDDLEAEYFINLVSYERAATQSLKSKIAKKRDRLAITRNKIYSSMRSGSEEFEVQVSDEDFDFYMHNWFCPAIQNILHIPELRSNTRIAEQLSLSLDLVDHVLSKLEAMGLIHRMEGEWQSTMKVLKPVTPFDRAAAHNSLQDRARQKNVLGVQNNFRANWTASISKKSFEELKNMMRKAIEGQRDLSHREDEAELLVGFTCDLFIM